MNSAMSELTKALRPVIVPLKQKEKQAAIEAAKSHLAKELSDNYRIFGAQLRIDKPAKPGKVPERMVGVIVVDYAKKHNVEVLVDTRGKVAKVVDLMGAQPAYTAEEVSEARAIAEQDSGIASLAKRKGAFVSEFAPPPASDYARRIGLRYVVLDSGRINGAVANAIVDLSTRTLVQSGETADDSRSRR